MSNTTSRAPRGRCWRAGFLALSLIVSLTASSCGGRADEEPEPRLPAPLAEDLASRSDRIADLLAAGEDCEAAHAADDLQAAITDAVNAGRVPPAFQEELSSAANDLVNEVNCPPPPAEAEEDDENDGPDGGKGNGKNKGKGNEEKDD